VSSSTIPTSISSSATPTPTNPTLSLLTVSAGTLSPSFSPTTLSYSVPLSNRNTTVYLIFLASADTIVVANTGTSIPIDTLGGSKVAMIPLSVGVNTIAITLTLSGQTSVYTIRITRAFPPSSTDTSVTGRMKLTSDFSAITDLSKFKSDLQFEIAKALDIGTSRINIVAVTAGSVIVEFEIKPPTNDDALPAIDALTQLQIQAADKTSQLHKGTIGTTIDSSYPIASGYICDGVESSTPCTLTGAAANNGSIMWNFVAASVAVIMVIYH
jgi:hypothetical protein